MKKGKIEIEVKPLISFIIPCYNKEAYVADAINSLLNQTEQRIEIIVVDDRSTDDSMEVIDFLAKTDKRIKIIALTENKGRSYARNIGNSAAIAPILAVQDADDISSPDRAEETIKAFKGKIDVFYSSFYSEGYQIQAKPFDIEEVKKDKYTYIGHSTMAYRKQVLEKVMYSEGEWSDLGIDDWKFQVGCYKAGFRFGHSDKPLLYYRQVGNSISKDRSEADSKKILDMKNDYLERI